MADKRKAPSPPPSSAALVKRARGETPPPTTQIAISAGSNDRAKALIRNVQRTSGLDAPIVSLAGAHSVSTTSRCLCFYLTTRVTGRDYELSV